MRAFRLRLWLKSLLCALLFFSAPLAHACAKTPSDNAPSVHSVHAHHHHAQDQAQGDPCDHAKGARTMDACAALCCASMPSLAHEPFAAASLARYQRPAVATLLVWTSLKRAPPAPPPRG